MKTILVTGGAGFIGSYVVDRLLERGCHVVCIDDFNDSYPPRFKRQNIVRHLKNPSFTLIEADITEKGALESAFGRKKIDSIIHLAARAGVRASIADPMLFLNVNVLGTYNILSLAQKCEAKQFIFASSSSVYGGVTVPFSEDSPANTPLSPYGASKRAAELACFTFHHLYKLPVTVLRLFSVYGPRGRPDMAPYLFTQGILSNKPIIQYGDGKAARDWTYIDDIIDGIMLAVAKPLGFGIINLGNGHPITLRELVTEIERATDKKALIKKLPAQQGEMRKTWASINKAKKALGWQPKVNLPCGVRYFVNWFKRYRL